MTRSVARECGRSVGDGVLAWEYSRPVADRAVAFSGSDRAATRSATIWSATGLLPWMPPHAVPDDRL
ncbi:hypothetical protein [Paenibacillus sp. DYY-L-2]|uniref:hypothetical protein n=1 Tax=Paenibacillus sp. DYY-L-2 TaxID=3447013 RepID=UPI003F502C0D